MRVDGGLIPSPVGLVQPDAAAEPQPDDRAAVVAVHAAARRSNSRGPRTTLLGAVYAYGAHGNRVGRRWDARVAVIDTSPLRTRRIFARTNPPRFTNVVVGGGVTPLVGLRVGGSLTHGGWQRAGESPAITADRDATIVTLESE